MKHLGNNGGGSGASHTINNIRPSGFESSFRALNINTSIRQPTQREVSTAEFQSSTVFPPPIPPILNKQMIVQERYGGLRFADEREVEDDVRPKAVEIIPWRMRERMKTMDVALVLCLNIGTDPPDIVKSSPCARKECWVDPFSMPAQKALETIGKTMQSQYERWQPRARYRQSLDPTVDEIKQISVSMRRHAKHDRVLFHYNGHGVPRPTPNGEIWVFNKSYTQYIPLLVYDLQSWIGTPAVYVFDCSAAGILLSHFNTSMNTEDNPPAVPPSTPSIANESIVLAACGANEILPMNPELCADVFTSCLTTPITVALRWFIAQNEMSMAHVDASFIDKIPGKLTDRKTPLGELNWIFTAITDTIAWNVLPRELFQKLFRQDLLVASLFRNFLLAERIMTSAGCTPCSLPALPTTHHHPLWRSWDLAAEICLHQLYRISHPPPSTELTFQPSTFFAEQLTAFEVWLQFGSELKPPPQQLPMVLQVLLSQVHRLRALILLKQFLDLGPWAVNLALSVGIFPYVVKLLQSPASELRQVLVFIWAKILALDSTCQLDLIKDDGHSYFISYLASSIPQEQQSLPFTPTLMPAEQKVMTCFVLSIICNQCLQGQKSCLQQYLHRICANLLSKETLQDVCKWICLCLSKLWEQFEDAKRMAIDDKLPSLLVIRLREDERPDVRAAAAVAIGTLVGFQFDSTMYRGNPNVDSSYIEEFVRQRGHSDVVVASELLWGCQDASPLVRRECVLSIASLVLHTYHQPRFETVARYFKNRSHCTRTPSNAAQLSNDQHVQPLAVHSESEETSSPVPPPLVTDTAKQLFGDKCFPIGINIPVECELYEEIGPDAKYYTHIWHILKELQAHDPFPKVVEAVKLIVSRVNTNVLNAEQKTANSHSNSVQIRTKKSISATLIETEVSANSEGSTSTGGVYLQKHAHAPSSGTMKMRGSASAVQMNGMTPQNNLGSGLKSKTNEQSSQAPFAGDSQAPATGDSGPNPGGAPHGLIRPTQSVGNFRAQYQEAYDKPDLGLKHDHVPSGQHSSSIDEVETIPRERYTRSTSDNRHLQGQWEMPASNPLAITPPISEILQSYGRHTDFPSSLCSAFYERQKARFNEPMLDQFCDDDDPLSEKGAARLERMRKYARVHQHALRLAPGFSEPPSSRTRLSPYGQGLPPSSSPSSHISSLSTPRTGFHGDREEVRNFSMSLRQRAVLNNEAEMTSLLLFHPFETMLIVADEKDQISLYNFEQTEKKILTFGNRNPTGSRLTSLSWINESEESLLVCGSDDGVIRVYHGLHSPHSTPEIPKLLTGFQAVPDLVPGARGSGLISTWQQKASMLFTGGNSSILRGWNMQQEKCTFSIPTQTDWCITTLASDETTSGTVVAGFGDGSLRLFDPRSRPEMALKCTMKEHTSWVVQTHVYEGKNELLSGSVSGEIKFWDLRYSKSSVRSLEAHRQPMTALAVHSYAPIFASGSHNQFIKVFRSDGEQVALIRYHEGFLGERIGPVSCLAFHPHRLFLAAGATDSVVAIYSSEK